MRRNVIKSFCFGMVFLLSACDTSSSNNQEYKIMSDNNEKIVIKDPTINFNKNDGYEHHILSESLTEFVSNYSRCSGDLYMTRDDIYFPSPLTFTWTYDESEYRVRGFIFEISDSPLMENADRYFTYNNGITLSNLSIDTKYYYQVTVNYLPYIIKSRIYSFTTDYSIRTIRVDNVSNTRDVGGHLTNDGKHRMKQGMVYRGANVDSITDEGREVLVGQLGVVSDIDLREPNSVSNLHGVSPLGEDVNLFSYGSSGCGCPYYTGDTGINSTHPTNGPIYRNALLNYLKIFTVESNYPAYFHCAIGRDRTGTIAFLLQCLCDVVNERMLLDYEFSFMSRAASGDNQTATYMMNGPFNGLYSYIDNYSTGTMKENAEEFCLDLGLTRDEITSIQTLLTEEI